MNNRHLVLLVGAFFWLACLPGTCCNLPLDPNVVVLPEGVPFEKTAWGPGAYGGRPGPHVACVADEDTPVSFRAYLDVTGKPGSELATRHENIGGHAMDLITLPAMQTLAEAKLKFSELIEEQNLNDADPGAISLGGDIKEFKISGDSSGGHFGESFTNREGHNLGAILPNPGNTRFKENLGPGEVWEVTRGKYKHEGKFFFKLLTSTFEFDKSGIEGETTVDGGADGVAAHQFNVPTSNAAGDSPKEFFYACVGKVDLVLGFKDIVWTWHEEHRKKNTADPPVWEVLDSNDESVELTGEITRTSDGSEHGHPGYFYVKTRDKNPAIYSRMTGTLKGPSGTTGETLPGGFSVTFDLVDNNPVPSESSIPTDFFYTLAVTDYLSGNYSCAGMAMDKLKYAEYKDKLIWKKVSGSATFEKSVTYPSKADSDSLPGKDIPEIGKVLDGPLTNSVSSWKAEFTIPEKMGYHYAKESNDESAGRSGGLLLKWEEGRLKYFVIPKADASGNDGIVYEGPSPDAEEPGAKDAIESNEYAALRAAIPAPTLGNPTETWEDVEPTEKKQYAIGNFGTFEVTDNDPANVFLAIKDTKFNQTHIFGNNTTTMDSGTGPFTGYSQTTDNSHIRPDTAMAFNFTGLDSDGEEGYRDFRATYDGKGEYVFHNAGEDNNGFWVDEDTKLEFFSWGYDNLNTYSSSHGLADGSVAGGADPCWWKDNMSFGSFSIADTPGGGGGSWFQGYIFRYPNRPKSLNAGDCSVTVSGSDGRNGTRTVKVNVYVIWNKKDIRALEERKNRK